MELKTGEIWQDFIRKGLNPELIKNDTSGTGPLSNYLTKSAQLRQDFVDRLLLETAVPKNEDQLRVLIYGNQVLLSYLINLLNEYMEKGEQTAAMKEVYATVIKDLECNLSFLQRYFHRYFDFEAMVPFSLGNAYQKRIMELENHFPAHWQENDVNGMHRNRLFAMLSHQSNSPITFSQYGYLTAFISDLSSLTPPVLPALFDIPLMDFCIIQNFNATGFIAYVVAFAEDKVQQFETITEKKEWLTRCLKQLYQVPSIHKKGLFDEHPSVKDTLTNWLEQENFFLEAVQKKEQAGAGEPVIKINTSVSVPVLALFTRVFKESGIITNSNLQEIFRFVSTHYTTQTKESISPGNFHGKYYKVDESTKRKVTDLLMDMLKVVKKIP